MGDLFEFVRESNRIEGIRRDPTDDEMIAHHTLLDGPMTIEAVEAFVSVIAPGHRLRDKTGLNVRVGNHIPPAGGPKVRVHADLIVGDARRLADPFDTHRAYETLHPFTDGNGRSGRAIWLWMMLNTGRDPYVLQRGFLHTWYYQSLAASSERRS